MSMANIIKKVAVDGSLVILWSLFARAHFFRFQESHEPYLLLMVVSESLIALMFLIRNAETSTSENPIEWIVAIAGTFAPMLLRPSGVALIPPLGGYIVAVGVCIQIAGVLSLNRSLGIVPANRGIKTARMYRFVRHPLYLSYVVTFSGYLLANYSVVNMVLVCGGFVLVIGRIFFEERHLLKDNAYQNYTQTVRWRLLPYVF